MFHYTIKPEKGFAMVEALVTALIVAIGVSGVGVLLIRAIQGTQDSAQQSQAMWLVQDFVGRMRANSTGAKDNSYVVNAAIDCDIQPAAMCSAHNNSGTSTSSTLVDCSAAQMATFDTWSTVCGLDDAIFDSPSDFISSPVLTSTCTQSDITSGDCNQYSVQLSWNIKLPKGSSIASERTNTNSYSMIVEVN